MYWYFWVIVVALEAVAGAGLVRYWLPDIPAWFVSLALLLSLTLTNLFSVRSFGEFEFWFASIKVAAIVVFLVLGVSVRPRPMAGGRPRGCQSDRAWRFRAERHPSDPDRSGRGYGLLFGAEIVTIAAAETAEPAKAVAKATNSVIRRVLLFYVGSILLVVCLVPWNSAGIATPYVSALTTMGVPAAAQIMNAVVLTAVPSPTEFRSVCVVANAVRAHRARRCPGGPCQAQPQWRAGPRHSARYAVRLRCRGHVVRLAQYRVRVSGQLLRNGGDIRVRADRRVAAAAARAIGTGGSGAAPDTAGGRIPI